MTKTTDALAEQAVGERQGQRTDKGQLRQNIAEVEPGERTADAIARKVGLGNRETYRQTEYVVAHAAPKVLPGGFRIRAAGAPASFSSRLGLWLNLTTNPNPPLPPASA